MANYRPWWWWFGTSVLLDLVTFVWLKVPRQFNSIKFIWCLRLWLAFEVAAPNSIAAPSKTLDRTTLCSTLSAHKFVFLWVRGQLKDARQLWFSIFLIPQVGNDTNFNYATRKVRLCRSWRRAVSTKRLIWIVDQRQKVLCGKPLVVERKIYTRVNETKEIKGRRREGGLNVSSSWIF